MRALDVRSLSVRYGPVRALERVSLHLDANEVVCVLGPNGAGKSTLVRAMSGQVSAFSGTIRFGNEILSSDSASMVARTGIVLCPEGRRVFHSLSVRENLEVPVRSPGRRSAQYSELIKSILDLLPNLKARLQQKAGTLSGGEQQMLAIGRALMARPRVLLMDEPSLGLAPVLVAQVFGAIKRIADSGVPVLLVEQNAYAALKISDRGYLLKNGKVEHQGTSDEMRTYLEAHSGYLG